MRFFKDLTLGFSSGALAGILQSMIYWVIAHFDLAKVIEVHFSVPDQWSEIYPVFIQNLLWGGTLGLLIAIPIFQNAWIKKGLVLGILPSLFFLLYFFPYVAHSGMFGLNHGNFAFVIVLILGLFYGLLTTGWSNWMDKS